MRVHMKEGREHTLHSPLSLTHTLTTKQQWYCKANKLTCGHAHSHSGWVHI